MNKLQLTGERQVPITTDTLAFMQSAFSLFEKLAAFGGDNFILTGCAENGTAVESGYMVLGGMLVYCPSQPLASTLYVKETLSTKTVGAGQRKELTYEVVFGVPSSTPATGQTYNWSDINIARPQHLQTLQSAQTALTDRVNILDGYKPRVEDLEDDVDALEQGVTTLDGGKLPKPIRITTGDLNSYNTPGMYYCISNTDATNIANVPHTLAFSLFVEKTSNSTGVNQTFKTYGTKPRTFVRGWEGTGAEWGEWIEQAMMYTSLSQLGLSDNDFSLTDWDANARAIFNAMPPFSTFKAGNVGAAEMPKLNASMIAGGIPLASGGAVTAALEFNKEAHTSNPCIIWAKNNNNSRQAYYNVDDAGSGWMELATTDYVQRRNKVATFTWTSGTFGLPNFANVFIHTTGGIDGDTAVVSLPQKGGIIEDGSQVTIAWPRVTNYGERIKVVAPAGYTFYGGLTQYYVDNDRGISFILEGTVYYAIGYGSSFDN